MNVFKRVLKGVCVGVGVVGVGAGVCAGVDMYRLRWSESHSISSAASHYLTLRCMKVLGAAMMNRINKDSHNFMQIQKEFLLKQLMDASTTAYGRDMNFQDMKNIDDFRQLHPLTRYDHFAPYIERIKRGEDNVLTTKPPQILGVTSGTSGQSRLLPTTADIATTFFLNGVAVIFDAMFSWKTDLFQLQRGLKIFFTPKPRESECGIPIGPNSTNPKNSKGVLHMYSTPVAAYDIMTEPEAVYVQLLFALTDRNLGMIEANFASLVYNTFRTLEQQWPSLVEDIRKGRINPDISIPEEIRNKLECVLRADPTRADELRDQFSQGFTGIAQRIWPHLNLILCATTGSQQLYYDRMSSHYCRGSAVYSPLYAATEGLLGVNTRPHAQPPVYNLVPRAMFYEFIPVELSSQNQPPTLLSDQVEVGGVYELVVSNNSGLYRYRVGDVVRVDSFHNQAPVVHFMYRQAQLLNVRGEKMDEETLFRSLHKVTGSRLMDYCCAESAAVDSCKDREPHYVIFAEYQEGHASQHDAAEVDAQLRKDHFVYDSFRGKGSVGPPRVVRVRPGTFRALRTHLLHATHAAPHQFKIPRVLHKESAIQFLMDNIEE